MLSSLHIIYTTSSGNTEHVVNELCMLLAKKAKKVRVTKQYAEEAQPNDLERGDLLILACGSWNTGGIEGQLQPRMFEFLNSQAHDADLKGKPVAVIGLGDARYLYTARAGEHLQQFVETHNGKLVVGLLKVVNDPYGQEKKIQAWGEKLLTAIKSI
ncbi:MAG TPA: flavodoxin domain-containing protein [Candidatus Peribacteraceae bacterium]|nr:flavodoxin domain-containing protein [Candidatus Peribacteraceae bacterium]